MMDLQYWVWFLVKQQPFHRLSPDVESTSLNPSRTPYPSTAINAVIFASEPHPFR
jgi:hypothetical protein